MARKMVVTATGKSYTATTTPATVQIPFNSADMWPSLLTVSATAPVHIKLGDPSVSATTNDLMVQPADHVTIRTNGAGYISYRSASGTCNVQISPTEDGPMNYRGFIPDYIQGILAPYGSNAHVYLPGASGATVAGFQTGNYTSNDGSTGLSAIDGACGLVLDGAGSVGAELVTNGGFDVDLTGWTNNSGAQSWSAGALRRTPGGAASGSYQEFATTANQTYLLTGNANPISGTGAQQVVAYQGGGFATQLGSTSASVSGPFQFFFVATSATTRIYLYSDGTKVVDYDAISCKPVTGIHASQSSGAARPGVRRGLYNLLSYSNTPSNGAWIVGATSVSGNRIAELATSAEHSLYETATVVSGTPYTRAFVLQAAERTWAYVRHYDGTTNTGAKFDLVNGVVGTVDSGVTASIAPYAAGQWLCVVTFTPTSTSERAQVTLLQDGVSSSTYLGDTSKGLNLIAAGLFSGSVTAQQILSEGGIPLTLASAASNQSAGRYSWQFDGTNDSLALGSVPLAHSDDYCVGFALRADNTTSFTAYGQAAGAATTNILVGVASGAPQFFCRDSVGTTVNLSTGVVSAGQTCVVSGRKVGNTRTVALNGSVTQTDTTALLADTMLAAAIGCRPGSTPDRFANGVSGAGYVIKGVVSDADRLILDRWISSVTPSGPTF